MTIMVIGGEHEQAMLLAQMLRGAQITRGGGALILLRPGNEKGKEHALQHQIEKLLKGIALPPDAKAENLSWKPDPLVLVPLANIDLIDAVEALVPGFIEKCGPVLSMADPLNVTAAQSQRPASGRRIAAAKSLVRSLFARG